MNVWLIFNSKESLECGDIAKVNIGKSNLKLYGFFLKSI